MAQMPATSTTHDLTMAEIRRLMKDYRDQRQAAVAELVQHEQRRAKGQAPPPQLTDDDKAIRARALTLINGYGKAADFLPPPASREAALRIEISALDMVCDALSQRETQARATEALQWQQAYGEEWRQQWHGCLLAAKKFEAHVARLREMKAAAGMYAELPLARFAVGRGVLDINWSADPLAAVLQAAIAEKIVTEREVREAQRV